MPFLGESNLTKTTALPRIDVVRASGFTLIELIVVIGILGILAVAALVVLNPLAQFQKADDARRKSDLAQIQRGLELYYQDHNQYPAYTTDTYQISGVVWGSNWSPYMSVLPSDPIPTNHYVYYVSTDGQSYYLYTSLDRPSSSDLCKGVSPVPCGSTTACGSGNTCNYGVSSSNVSP